MQRIRTALEKFARSIVQPIMYLSVAGLVLIIGIVLTNKPLMQMFPFLSAPPLQYLGKLVYKSLMFLINNLSVLFCVGIAMALAKKEKGHAALIALMSYFLFLQSNNITLEMTGRLAKAQGMLGLTGTGQASVLGMQVVDTGVFGGIILGCLVGWIFNRFADKEFPIALAMFNGVRFPFFIMIILSLFLGAGASYVWPFVQQGISSVAELIKNSGYFGLFLYGMLNKLLVPFGLHHLIYTPFQFSAMGGTMEVAGQVITGAYPIRVAQMGMPGPFSPDTYYNLFTFNNLAPYIGIGLAFIVTSYKCNKEKTKAMIIPLILTAVLSCITEPMDFLFCFSVPLLFVLHSVLSGINLVLLKVLNIPAANAGGIINIVISNLVLGIQKTNWPMLLVFGAVVAVSYFFIFKFLIVHFNLHTPGREVDGSDDIAESTKNKKQQSGEQTSSDREKIIADLIEGLGGKDNIDTVDCCFTRLRVNVKDETKINEDLINHLKNSGIQKAGNDIQIIIGMDVTKVRSEVEALLNA